MAQIRPFTAIRYARRNDLEASKLIAPPYDVLNAQQKAQLQQKHPNNIVNIDLPHLPAKEAGPADLYEQAARTLEGWLSEGVLVNEKRPAFYPYTQSYEHAGRTYHRRGFFALVKLSPFGAGHVIPHELTHKGPIQDRLALMRATGVQLSPIFGLYSDPRNEVSNLLYEQAGKPAISATLEDVKNDLWAVPDAEVENKIIDLMGTRNIYIADGHHRYTTALQYQAEMEQKHGGPLPPAHPANWCLFALVGMQDPGLIILPTHRLISGLEWFDIEAFKEAVGNHFDVSKVSFNHNGVSDFADEALRKAPPHTMGLFVGKTRTLFMLRLKNPAVLDELAADRSAAWRKLDVAILHRYLIDEVLVPNFAGGKTVKVEYTADAATIAPQVDGEHHQVAFILQPTPLMALEELGKAGDVMPQKSTYFYPKLATGMVINPLR